MGLINRYYSANDNLFKRAVQAQVLITPESVKAYKEVLEILPTLQVRTCWINEVKQTVFLVFRAQLNWSNRSVLVFSRSPILLLLVAT